ncbi:MAG: phosphoglycerate mutase family protein [Gemmatimonadetes bacterium]|nr:phosphoglycerate mutase family protein [Gemmatimonadota bacterium]
MQTLILVKHSLPEIDPSVPAKEWVLSDEGRRRARKLGERLDRYSLDLFVSSIEPKAMETAEITAGVLKIPMEIVEGLHEHERVNVGFLEKERFEQSIRRFYEQPFELVFGEETADSAYGRFSKAVHRITDRYPKENIVIVTHGTVLSLFVSHNSDLEPFALWKKLGLPSWIVLSRPGFDVVEICPGIGDEESIGGA